MKKPNIHVFIWKFVIGIFLVTLLMTYMHSNTEITNLSMLFYAFKFGLWVTTAATILICLLMGLAKLQNNKPEKNEIIYSWFNTSTKYTLVFICTLAIAMQLKI